MSPPIHFYSSSTELQGVNLGVVKISQKASVNMYGCTPGHYWRVQKSLYTENRQIKRRRMNRESEYRAQSNSIHFLTWVGVWQ